MKVNYLGKVEVLLVVMCFGTWATVSFSQVENQPVSKQVYCTSKSQQTSLTFQSLQPFIKKHSNGSSVADLSIYVTVSL